VKAPAKIRAGGATGEAKVVTVLVDSALELLAGVEIRDDPVRAFEGVDVALLLGAKPRGKGMERADLLAANAAIFADAGRALNAGAARCGATTPRRCIRTSSRPSSAGGPAPTMRPIPIG
jgi:hypothetical protein